MSIPDSDFSSAPPSEPAPPDPPALSRSGTVLSSAVLLLGLALMLALQFTASPIDRVENPERALELMAGRMLDLEDGLAQRPAWERFLYEGTTGSGLNELEQAIIWFSELDRVSPDPTISLELAVLEGEAGHVERVGEQVKAWSDEGAPFSVYSRVLEAAYRHEPMDPQHALLLQSELAELLPAGWFYDRVAGKIAARAHDAAFVARLTDTHERRGDSLVHRTRVLTAIEMAVIVMGLPAWLVVLRRRRSEVAVGGAPVPPPWPLSLGLGVLVRGGAAALLLTIALLYLDGGLPVRLASMPVAVLPLWVLTRRYLAVTAGTPVADLFGIRLLPGGRRHLAAAVLAVLSLGFVGEWIMGIVAGQFNISSHWTEWFDSDLAWGDGSTLAISLIEFVLFAPVFEEFAFRGLLFGTLRTRFGFWRSSTLSAGVFALAHGYGVLGFVSVLWSGVLWAWVYEKTGSLVPGMVAHAANNLIVCVTVMALLRY